MSRTIEKTVYTFNELDAQGQSRAVHDLQEVSPLYPWHGATYDDFVRVCDLMGIETRAQDIQFSGFYSQGDGASFTGSIKIDGEGFLYGVKQYAPKDKTLHGIAADLEEFVTREGAPVPSTVEIVRLSSRYSHENTVEVAQGDSLTIEEAREITDIIRRLCHWLYRALEAEHDYLTSDDYLTDQLRESGHEFYQDGALFKG